MEIHPPAALHFGGKWEAEVKSVKGHLRKVIGNTLLTYEEFSTVLVQIEAVLNSRPLCSLSDDPNSYEILTPGHFLIGTALNVVPEASLYDEKTSRLSRWQHLRKIIDDFWKNWSRSYLQKMQIPTKWFESKNLPREGQLVLLQDKRYPPSKWLLARIIKLHAGSDGLERVVSKTPTTTLTRPLTKIYLLLDID
ncbi:uncharacterized protein [Onthophagus taurus]|uniref:uncharacterized protein n=1 Tax=Onthophagus taurus TaxID=166361 RepID=UPI0039BEB08C